MGFAFEKRLCSPKQAYRIPGILEKDVCQKYMNIDLDLKVSKEDK